MVKLSGLNEDDVPIVFTGLRPGEKLEEELSFDYETIETTVQSKLYCLRSPSRIPRDFDEKIQLLKGFGIRMEFDEIRLLLREIVPEYQPMQASESVAAPIAQAG
jgi:FlaA1/EpsC-like NDP-sugar epimerase